MFYKIKSPLTSAPKRSKHHSNGAWEAYKPLMITMRKGGHTAEQILLALRRRGFDVGLGPVKKRLRQWEPKYSSFGRKSILPKDEAMEMTREQTTPASQGEIVMSNFPQKNEGRGNYTVYDSEIKGQERAGSLIDPNKPDRDISSNQDQGQQLQADDDTARLIDIATGILGTLGLDLGLGAHSDSMEIDFPSFEEWESQQNEKKVKAGKKKIAGKQKPIQQRFGFRRLLKIATALGEIGFHRVEALEYDKEAVVKQKPPQQNVTWNSGPSTAQAKHENASNKADNKMRHERERVAAMKRVDRLLLKSGELYDTNFYLDAFIAARDSFDILKSWRPLEHCRLGFALYNMGWALLKSYQRFAEVIRIFKMAREYFGLAGISSWELETIRSIYIAQGRWPANKDERKHNLLQILEMVENMNPLETGQFETGELVRAKAQALRGLSSLLPEKRGREIARRMMRSFTKNHSSMDITTKKTISGLIAEILTDYGDYSHALEWYIQVYDISEPIYGVNHPYTLDNVQKIHYCLIKLGRFDDALIVHRRIAPTITITRAWTPDAITNVGRMLGGLGKHSQALELLYRGLNELKYRHNENTGFPEVEEWIADTLFKRGLVIYAQPIALDYLSQYEKNFGKNHPRTLDAILLYLKFGTRNWIDV